MQRSQNLPQQTSYPAAEQDPYAAVPGPIHGLDEGQLVSSAPGPPRYASPGLLPHHHSTQTQLGTRSIYPQGHTRPAEYSGAPARLTEKKGGDEAMPMAQPSLIGEECDSSFPESTAETWLNTSQPTLMPNRHSMADKVTAAVRRLSILDLPGTASMRLCSNGGSLRWVFLGYGVVQDCCIVLYEPLSPDDSNQAYRHDIERLPIWMPPTRRNAFIRGAGSMMIRWKGGRVTEDMTSNISERSNYTPYKCFTLFSQRPGIDHLYAVPFDVERKDVSEHYGGWQFLHFDHIPRPRTHEMYSSVDAPAEHPRLAAPATSHWIPQLVPNIYNYDLREVDPQPAIPPISAGLIGSLPILFALAAFSAPPNMLAQTLFGSLRPNTWLKHDSPDGRRGHRGMVVTVYLDPTNKKGSTKTLLDRVQEGYFGPFYKP
ncbi:MAG: hypothetical protein Q9219_004373 [cf. Caloplaca sp. 3 TL-2023]